MLLLTRQSWSAKHAQPNHCCHNRASPASKLLNPGMTQEHHDIKMLTHQRLSAPNRNLNKKRVSYLKRTRRYRLVLNIAWSAKQVRTMTSNTNYRPNLRAVMIHRLIFRKHSATQATTSKILGWLKCRSVMCFRRLQSRRESITWSSSAKSWQRKASSDSKTTSCRERVINWFLFTRIKKYVLSS